MSHWSEHIYKVNIPGLHIFRCSCFSSFTVTFSIWLQRSGFKYFSSLGPPSPPRNLRRSVVGALGANRQYHVFWSASHDTGGLSVNYSVQLCVNDSIEKLNNVCIWSSNSDCHPRNIITTKKDFSCILNKHDFENLCGMFCNYTLCVKASNDAGNATSCIFVPPIDRNSGKAYTIWLHAINWDSGKKWLSCFPQKTLNIPQGKVL